MIHDIIGKPAAYEALAEEATELAQAALKMARVLRGENPTPVTEEEAKKMIIEELTDVAVWMADLSIIPDEKLGQEKIARFFTRYNEAKRQNKEPKKKNESSFGEDIAKALFAGIMTGLMKENTKNKSKDLFDDSDEDEMDTFMGTWFSGFDFPNDKEDDDE